MYNNHIRITVSGAQGTGKTTLINALKKVYPFFDIQKEPVRSVIKKKENVNFADKEKQLIILEKQRNFLQDNIAVLTDRCPLDSLSYTKMLRDEGLSNIDDELFEYIWQQSAGILESDLIDIMILLPIEFPLIDDGFRVMDDKQQKKVQRIMEDYATEFLLGDTIIVPHGSVEERVEFCKEYIDKLLRKYVEKDLAEKANK